jgi:preprotein translocase subunit SecD
MRRMVSWTACSIVFLFAGIVQAQAQLSIRAASAEPVEGWQRMQVEHSDRFVWVSPTAAVTASDIEKAQPEVNSNGDTRIAVVFTEDGAKRMLDLTTAQRGKLIVMVVDVGC